ncbi:MAG TPA: nucleotide exchange factor GrpE [Bacilli bacterium]|nr:nucleotide exchange factor GrpE [Bacilli bacterium]
MQEEKKKKTTKKEATRKNNELIIDLNNKIKSLENKLLYKDAELINYRKRKDEEVSSMLKYSNADIILQILSVVDDLERAIKIDDNNLSDELSKFLEGFKMIYSKLISILNAFDVKEIEALGKTFDPIYHQAVITDSDETKENNTILDVLQKGYIYIDKVIRPAMVKVNIINKEGEDNNE